MNFQSYIFLLFAAVLLVGWRLMPSASGRRLWLLAAGLVFYGWGAPAGLLLLSISRPNDAGVVICRYVLDSEIMSCEVQVAQPTGQKAKGLTMADPANKFHVASPSNGDLWVMYVHPGDIVKAGEELFNVSIMKQEKAVLAPVDGVVKRVLKTADFKENKQMVSVREGELLVELGPVPRICSNEACAQPIPMDNVSFCPYCGSRVI